MREELRAFIAGELMFRRAKMKDPSPLYDEAIEGLRGGMREPDEIHKALSMARFGSVWIGCEENFVLDCNEQFAMNRAEAEEYRDNIAAAIEWHERKWHERREK